LYVIPAEAGIQLFFWIPAYAGMTPRPLNSSFFPGPTQTQRLASYLTIVNPRGFVNQPWLLPFLFGQAQNRPLSEFEKSLYLKFYG
jgi:hypothetical protein